MILTDLLDAHGIPYRHPGADHHVSPGWVGLECPWCGPGSGKFHLGWYAPKRYLSCWKCGYKRIVDYLRIKRLPLEAKIFYQDGLTPHQGEKIASRGILLLPRGISELLPPHTEYLLSRGFRPETLVQLWNLKSIGIAPKLSWRLWVPIHQHGIVVSWTTRGITDREPRWVMARNDESAVPPKQVLYGADHARSAVIVVEGPSDVWRIGPGAVATLGIGWSLKQAQTLRRYPLRILCFDTEREAQERARRLCDDLAPFPGRTIRVQLDAPDPGSASPREIQTLRRLFLD